MQKYQVTEEDIALILENFNTFTSYVLQHQPKLSAKRGALSKKDLFALNSLLPDRKINPKPTLSQESYPTLNFLFHLAIESSLFEGGPGDRSRPTTLFEQFQALDPFAQYLFLFESYWEMDPAIIDPDPHSFSSATIEEALLPFWAAEAEEELVGDIEPYLYEQCPRSADPLTNTFVRLGLIINQLYLFGFWSYGEAFPFKTNHKKIIVASVTPTAFGATMTEICLRHARPKVVQLKLFLAKKELQGDYTIEDAIAEFEAREPLEKSIGASLAELFPKTSVRQLEQLVSPYADANAYLFKVSLPGGVWRKILMATTHTLEDLHREIQSAFNFDSDRLYQFRIGERTFNSPSPAYDFRDYDGIGTTTLAELQLRMGQTFVYHFDFFADWIFKVKLEEILKNDEKLESPEIVETRGEAPRHYYYLDQDEDC